MIKNMTVYIKKSKKKTKNQKKQKNQKNNFFFD